METSSSAKRTWSDSRSASEYTATVCTPSSRQARMTRSAISPRLAIKTFLNTSASGLRSAFEPRPRGVARAGHALHAQRELAGARREEHRALIGDDALRVPLHERLVEALHPVLHGAFLDEVRNVQDVRHVADLIAHRLRIDEHLTCGNPAGLVGAGHEAHRHHGLERAGQRETDLGLLVRWIDRQHALDGAGRIGGVQRTEHEVACVRGLERGVERLEIADFTDEDDVVILPEHAAQRLREGGRVGTDLALVDVTIDVAMEELDGILDRDDVRFAVLVDVLDHGRERGALSRTGNARDENKSAWLERDFLQNARQIQLIDGASLVRDGAHGIAERPALLIHVAAKAPDARHADGEVALLVLGELLHLPRRHQLLGQTLEILRPHGRHLERRELTVQAERRRAPDLQVKVRRTALHELVQHRLEVEGA